MTESVNKNYKISNDFCVKFTKEFDGIDIKKLSVAVANCWNDNIKVQFAQSVEGADIDVLIEGVKKTPCQMAEFATKFENIDNDKIIQQFMDCYDEYITYYGYLYHIFEDAACIIATRKGTKLAEFTDFVIEKLATGIIPDYDVRGVINYIERLLEAGPNAYLEKIIQEANSYLKSKEDEEHGDM